MTIWPLNLLRLPLLLLLAAVAALPALAQDTPDAAGRLPPSSQTLAAYIDATDSWLASRLAYERVPGAAIAIVHDQQLLFARGYGVAALDSGVPVTPDTGFSICSISKLFTATAVMQLRDVGKLDLDSPLQDILPDFAIHRGRGDGEPVTLRGILSHVAGLPREADLPYWTDTVFPDGGALQSVVTEQELLYSPFTRLQYSNLGMALAGQAVSKAARKPYARYVADNILQPLGLSGTTSELPIDRYGTSFSKGYGLRQDDGSRLALDPYLVRAMAPAAGFASSARDLARFAAWQFRLLDNTTPEVLKPSTLREMHRVHWLSPDWDNAAWGLGYAIRRHNGRTFVGHNGYCPGYRASLLIRPQEKIAVIVLVNVNDVSAEDIAYNLFDFIGPIIDETAQSMRQTGIGADGAPTMLSGAMPMPEPPVGAGKERFAAIYERPGMPTRVSVTATREGLLVLDLFSDQPAYNHYHLAPLGGGRFARITRDGALAEEVRFELDADGKAMRMWRFSNYLTARSGP